MIAEKKTTKEPGIYTDISFDEYLLIDAVNQSTLKKMDRSAAFCKASEDEDDKPTKPKEFGKLLHAGKLEPLTIARLYAVIPAYENDAENLKADKTVPAAADRKKTGYYKAKVKAFKKANIGKEFVEQSEYDLMVKMVETLDADSAVSQLFARGGGHESTVIWNDKPTGLLCKARIDCLILDEWPTIFDLKSAANADDEWHHGVRSFTDSIGMFGYDVQAGFYVDGVKAATGKDANFIIAAIEKNKACGMRMYDLTLQDAGVSWADIGRFKYRNWLNQYAECKKTGIWPGYPTGITTPLVPEYEARNMEHNIA